MINSWKYIEINAIISRVGGQKILTKIDPTKPTFPHQWQPSTKKNLMTKAVLCGKASDITIIDCDTQESIDIISKLIPPDYKWVFKSIGKAGANYIFKYIDLPSFRIAKQLDILNNNTICFLPCIGNETKESFIAPDTPIQDIPPVLLNFLYMLKPAQNAPHTETVYTSFPKYFLVKEYIENNNNDALKFIIPKKFQDTKIVPGMRSSFLLGCSTILGTDSSIESTLYMKAIIKLNSKLQDPLDDKELTQTIINPMISGQATVGNKSLWSYNEDWQSEGYIFKDKHNVTYELFFDKKRFLYFILNYNDLATSWFNTNQITLTTISNLKGAQVKFPMVASKAKQVLSTSDPTKEFGLKDITFNMFRSTEYLAILKHPENYNFPMPEATLKYFSILLPDIREREYIFRFLARRLITFDKTAVILYFIGVGGSGKNLLIDILKDIIGIEHVAQPTASVFIEKQNGWLLNKYLVELDEFGDTLAPSQRAAALGLLKYYTGNSTITIRDMSTRAFTTESNVLFIMSSNTAPLNLDYADRRFFYMSVQNKLSDYVDNMSSFYKDVQSEKRAFCQFLGKYEQEYQYYKEAMPTKHKISMIEKALPLYQRMAILISKGEIGKLKELVGNDDTLITGNNRVAYGPLYTYAVMDNNTLTERAFSAYLDRLGLKVSYTTKDGGNFKYVSKRLA